MDDTTTETPVLAPVMVWHLAPGATPEMLGLIPEFISSVDPRPLIEQIDDAYAHGGGWNEFDGFTLDRTSGNVFEWFLTYPGDPPLYPLAACKVRDEVLLFWPFAWVTICTKEGGFNCAKID